MEVGCGAAKSHSFVQQPRLPARVAVKPDGLSHPESRVRPSAERPTTSTARIPPSNRLPERLASRDRPDCTSPHTTRPPTRAYHSITDINLHPHPELPRHKRSDAVAPPSLSRQYGRQKIRTRPLEGGRYVRSPMPPRARDCGSAVKAALHPPTHRSPPSLYARG